MYKMIGCLVDFFIAVNGRIGQ
ncbi:DUF3976 domain-containing protein [Gottfriedia acidiceleris]